MDQPTPGSHPLHATRGQQALVAVVVLVAHAPVQHVGHGLEAAMWMAGEAGQVVGGLVGAELVQQQERVQVRKLRATDHPGELDPGAVGRGLAADLAADPGMCDCGGGHGVLQRVIVRRWRLRRRHGSDWAETHRSTGVGSSLPARPGAGRACRGPRWTLAWRDRATSIGGVERRMVLAACPAKE